MTPIVISTRYHSYHFILGIRNVHAVTLCLYAKVQLALLDIYLHQKQLVFFKYFVIMSTAGYTTNIACSDFSNGVKRK